MTTGPRVPLRGRLLAQREQFVAGPLAAEAGVALARHLAEVLTHLEPELLGLYWPHRSEFNAVTGLCADRRTTKWPFVTTMALPYAMKSPVAMHYRAWNGLPPTLRDECGIPACEGEPVQPDVVLVPCLGFTRSGYRLGYGAGYFDRWLAQHPEVTAVGVAWALGEVAEAEFDARPHDQPLALVVTEHGVVG